MINANVDSIHLRPIVEADVPLLYEMQSSTLR